MTLKTSSDEFVEWLRLEMVKVEKFYGTVIVED